MNIEGKYIETYKIFVVLLDKLTEKLDLQTSNDSVTPNRKKNIEGCFG